MKKIFIINCLLIISFTGCAANNQSADQNLKISNTDNMKITSSAYAENAVIPSKYTCDGDNVNPPFKFEEIPEGAKSLAIIYEDPDAPAGTWIHWIVWNINPENPVIAENSLPEGAVPGKTDFGNTAYGGPCPPGGTHRYILKGYALNTMLQLAPGSVKKDLIAAMKGHILAEAIFTGVYLRK